MPLSRSYLLKLFFIISLCLFLSGCSGMGHSIDFQTMLQNLAKSYPNLWRLLTASSYIMGFFFIFKAVYSLKIYGESRTMSSSQTSIKGPLANILAGVMLIFIPTAFSMINMTFFGTPNLLSYNQGGIGVFTQESIAAVLGVVQLVGLIAFIRGWVYIARAGESSGGQPVIGKALTHIIGGAFAINVVQVKDVIWNTFGFS